MRKVLLCLFLMAASLAWSETQKLSALFTPKFRLDDRAKPLQYSLDLTILPEQDTFAGAVAIDVEIRRPTSLLWLNANELRIKSAGIEIGHRMLPVRTFESSEDFLGLRLPRLIGPGKALVRIAYTGTVSLKDFSGIFRQKEGDDWYAYSQFEEIAARRAFPCFDEPSFKVPWQLALHVRKEHVAVSNTPVESEAQEPNDMKKVTFQETKPLPSYLVAFAVGPFEVVDAGKAGRRQTPLRIITPRGRAAEARYAAETTHQIFDLLENYFGISYPYEKLDQVAIPSFFGAMENAGTITFWEQGLLAKPEEETISWKRTYASTCAHEVAHQWFGDLVTMKWWNDVWLNESFADWMDTKILDQWKPEWDISVSRVRRRSDAMVSDSLVTARKIRQPVETPDDIENAFDNITYGKGEAVLEMFENWIGKERFQKGVQRYLSENAWGNATAEDFLKAMSAEAGFDVALVFSTFLDQPGVPLVSTQLKCTDREPPKLVLTQKRYLPIGSSGKSAQIWQIPVCVKYGTGRDVARTCTLLQAAQTEVALQASSCPDWIFPDEGASGYYRVRYTADFLTRLLNDSGKLLTVPERVGLLGDIDALMNNGEIAAGDALALIPRVLEDSNPHIIAATIGLLSGVSEYLVPDELRPSYERFIQQMYGKKASEIGWQSAPEEPDAITLLRPRLLSLVANEGEDPEFIGQAADLAHRWLKDRTAVQTDMVETVLVNAARHGDRSLFDQFAEQAKATNSRNEQDDFFAAMGSFLDPEIEKNALSIILSNDFDASDSLTILEYAISDPKSRDLAWNFTKTNFDTLLKKLPEDYTPFLPRLPSDYCDEQHKKDVETFFTSRIGTIPGAPRNLRKTLEEISLCIAKRKVQEPSVASFLQSY